MHYEVYSLSEDNRITLTAYTVDKSTVKWNNKDEWQPDLRPAVIICPGGGYTFLSQREGEPVALSFLQQGYQAFVLHYSLNEYSIFPNPLDDISKAVWFVRSHADEFCINPNQISVGGFSAGGHVSALLGTQWNTPGLCQRLHIPDGGNRPNAMFLCYAATDFNNVAIKSSKAVTCSTASIIQQQAPESSTQNYISEDTPPTFLWMTREDFLSCTEYFNFAAKLYHTGIPFELHIFGEGPHGMSLSSPLVAYGYELPTNVGYWFPMCINWLNKLYHFGNTNTGKTCTY